MPAVKADDTPNCNPAAQVNIVQPEADPDEARTDIERVPPIIADWLEDADTT